MILQQTKIKLYFTGFDSLAPADGVSDAESWNNGNLRKATKPLIAARGKPSSKQVETALQAGRDAITNGDGYNTEDMEYLIRAARGE